jgi:radical SAM protein with 4Fe4S-binding SPASM domain
MFNQKFKRVHVEISNICNVQCSFCPVVSKPKEVLGTKEFKHILDQVAPMAEDVCLHLLGEPLAHPEFEEILDICDEADVKIQLTTNGLLLNRHKEKLLKSRSLRQINFSLQVFKDNFPDKDPYSYLDEVYTFTQEAFEEKEDLYINYRLWDTGTEDNEDYLESIEKRFELDIKRSLDLKSIKSKRLINRLYLHFDSRFDWPSPFFPTRSEKGFCYGLINHFGIHADGTVVPCCLDKDGVIDLGNIFKKPLVEILKGERASAIKSGFENGRLVEDLCQKCTFIKRFDGKIKNGN